MYQKILFIKLCIVYLVISERYISDRHVEKVVFKGSRLKSLYRNVCQRIKLFRNPAR